MTTMPLASPSASPTSRQPAPGGLRLVQEFVNSCDVEEGTDQWATPQSLASWLHERALIAADDRVTGAQCALAVAVREALRALALANTEDAVDPAALAVLDHVAEGAPLRVVFGADGSAELEPTVGGVRGALGTVLARVQAAMADGTWRRFKACPEDSCQWAFWDSSKNCSGHWCSMRVCGSRAKTRAYRRRGRAT
jgi:predicted RNA-binding Zn ribbon-like protein